MQTIHPTKLAVLKFLVFWLYLAAGICIAIFAWTVFSDRQPNANPDFMFLLSAIGFGLPGLICDIICDIGMYHIRNEQRQELILEELKRIRD